MLRFITAVVLFTYFCNIIKGQEIGDSLVQEVIITATKFPTALKESSKSIVVIDSESIKSSGLNDIAQLLDQQVGIRINGALSNPGLNRSIYIQGGSSESVLFLIDGMPLNDPSTIGGAFDIRNLSLAGIERIEILKGSQSTLYGSNAISGVINIITNKQINDGLSLSGQISFGSLNSRAQSITGGFKTGNTTINVSGSFEESDGVSEAKNLNPESVSFDSDGYSRTNLNIDLEHRFSDQFSIRPFYRNNSFSSAFDAGSFTDSGDRYESFYHSLGLQSALVTDIHDVRLLYSYTDTDRSFFTSFGPSIFDGNHHNLDAFDKVRISQSSNLTIGLNYQAFGMIDGGATVADPSETIFSPYALYNTSIGSFNGSLGFRYNNHSQYGSNSTYEIAGSYQLNSAFKLIGSYTTGFKAPLLPQLYGAFGANPDLVPEESNYWTVGVNYLSTNTLVDFSLNYFDRGIDNIIIFGSDPVSGGFGYFNLEQQDDSGFEAQLNFSPDNFSIGLAYTRLTGQTSTNSGDVISEVLLRRPKNQIDLNLSYTGIDGLLIGLDLNFTGEREDLFFDFNTFETNSTVLESYNNINLSAQYRINDAFTLFGRINNLFKSDYEEVAGYNNLGRFALIGIRFDVLD